MEEAPDYSTLNKNDLVKLVNALQLQVTQVLQAPSLKQTKVHIPEPSMENRMLWERAVLRSAEQGSFSYLIEDLDPSVTTTEFLESLPSYDTKATFYKSQNKALYFRIWESIKDGSPLQRHLDGVPISDGRALYVATCKLLQPQTRASMANCQRDFFNCTQKSPTGFLDFTHELQSKALTCKQLGVAINEDQVLNALISGLHPTYNVIANQLKLLPTDDLTFDKAVEILTAWGTDNLLIQDFKSGHPSGGKPGRPALYNFEAKNETKPRTAEVCRNFLRGRCYNTKCKRQHPERKPNKSQSTCNNCGKTGHWAATCWSKKPAHPRGRAHTSSRPSPSVNLFSESVPDDTPDDPQVDYAEAVVYAFRAPTTGTTHTTRSAAPPPTISDSGASHSITCDAKIVSNVHENTVEVKHIGGSTTPSNTATAAFPVMNCQGNRHNIVINEAFFDKGLSHQIISEGQSTSQGYEVFKSGDLCTYALDGDIVATCHKVNNIYIFHDTSEAECHRCQHPSVADELAHHKELAAFSFRSRRPKSATPPGVCLMSAGGNVSKKASNAILTWHLRLGHLNFPTVCKILGLPYKPETIQLCMSCYRAKMHMLPHNRSPRERAPGPLRWIWMDGYGPVDVPTPSGCRHYLVICDDFSRKFWILLTRTKADYYEAFVKWKLTLENEMQTTLARLYCDVDTVLTQDALQADLAKTGTQLLPAAPYEHWMTGLPERGHRTIMESAQACRLFAGMPKTAWGEAAMFALHVHNHVWKQDLGKSPHEAFTGKSSKPARDNTRIFGCLAMAHISKESPARRGKLADKAQACVYLGPCNVREGLHRLLTWPKRRVIVSYSVAFDETKFPFRGAVKHVDMTANFESIGNFEDFTDYTFPAIDDEDYGPLEVDQFPTSTPARPPRSREPSAKALENIVNASNFHSSIFSTRAQWGKPPQYSLDDPLFVPRSSNEARRCRHSSEWRASESKEIDTLHEANVLQLIHPKDADPNIQIVGCDFRYRIKTDADGKILPGLKGRRARLVLLGHLVNRSKANIRSEDCYASVATYASLRVIMALACQFGWDFDHYDVSAAFLNAKPRRKIYMRQPPGFEVKGKEDWIIELQKCLYGDPEAGSCWQQLVVETLIAYGARTGYAEDNAWIISKNNQHIEVVIWVDDFFVSGNCKGSLLYSNFINHCNKFFKLNYLGPATHALGLKVQYNKEAGTLKLSSPALIDQLLHKNSMSNCNPAATPSIPGHYVTHDDSSPPADDLRSLVGTGVHLSRTCRPDLSYATNSLARVASDPRKVHEPARQRFLRYCKGTKDFGITMVRNTTTQNPIQVYVDADFAGDETDRKSTTGILVKLFGFPVAWSSKKQNCVTLSSCEAEYVACCEAGKLAIWLHEFLTDLALDELPSASLLPIPIYEDNKSTIHMTKGPLNHGRSKHVDTRYHWIREKVKERKLKIIYCPSTDQLADTLTKPVTVTVFQKLMQLGFMGHQRI